MELLSNQNLDARAVLTLMTCEDIETFLRLYRKEIMEDENLLLTLFCKFSRATRIIVNTIKNETEYEISIDLVCKILEKILLIKDETISLFKKVRMDEDIYKLWYRVNKLSNVLYCFCFLVAVIDVDKEFVRTKIHEILKAHPETIVDVLRFPELVDIIEISSIIEAIKKSNIKLNEIQYILNNTAIQNIFFTELFDKCFYELRGDKIIDFGRWLVDNRPDMIVSWCDNVLNNIKCDVIFDFICDWVFYDEICCKVFLKCWPKYACKFALTVNSYGLLYKKAKETGKMCNVVCVIDIAPRTYKMALKREFRKDKKSFS